MGSLEDHLFVALLQHKGEEDLKKLLAEGADPNKVTSQGKTALGQAAFSGNMSVLKLLINDYKSKRKASLNNSILTSKSHKEKVNESNEIDESVRFKFKKNYDESWSNACTYIGSSTKYHEKNQGYFVFIHDDKLSEGVNVRVNNISSPTSSTLTPSPQGDLEWEEEINGGNIAATTSEDDSWASMYKWYAAILEHTGPALQSAASVFVGIDQQDTHIRTALHYASEQGHVEAVNTLIEAGAKLDIPASDGLTALHLAIIKSRPEVIKKLIDAGCRVNQKTHDRMTALHFAASRGFLDIVQWLVKAGAHLEARDASERTALYLAAGRGHDTIVRFLASAGANVNGEEIHGYTPLCESVWQRYANVVKVLLASGARITPMHKLLHNAVLQYEQTIARMLAAFGVGINQHNDNGFTPLLLAVKTVQPQMIKMLLEQGANVNVYNSITGANALHIAVEYVEKEQCFDEIFQILLEYGIDLNCKSLTGDTPLNRANLLLKDCFMVKLIKHGAAVNGPECQGKGWDNLTIACGRRSTKLVNFLMKAGHKFPIIPDSEQDPGVKQMMHSFYLNMSRQPMTLSDICRITIRNMHHGKLTMAQYIDLLQLPQILKQFLMFEDYDEFNF